MYLASLLSISCRKNTIGSLFEKKHKPIARAETAREKWRGKKWQHSECMGAMLGVDHEEYRVINGWHIHRDHKTVQSFKKVGGHCPLPQNVGGRAPPAPPPPPPQYISATELSTLCRDRIAAIKLPMMNVVICTRGLALVCCGAYLQCEC